MATPGYTEELQPSQPQGCSITPAKANQQKATPTATPQFLPEIQSPSSSTSAQTTAYVTSEIQSSASQSSNGQSTPQFIVVTVTEGSLHSNDSVSDSSPPPAVQTGVPTHVVQQVQAAQVTHTHTHHTHTLTHLGILLVAYLKLCVCVCVQIAQVAQHVYSSQIQYVDGDANYNSTPIRSSAYPYTDSSLYTQATPPATYYEAPPTSASQVSTPVTSQPVSVATGSSSGAAPMYSCGGGAGVTVVTGGSSSSSGGGAGGGASGAGPGSYVVQGGYLIGGGSQSYSPHHTRASPVTVQWLCDNYETAEGVSLPRCTLYCHYLLHCQEAKLDPVNAASFGKLIRSVFLGLRTRRLGTRGNSKYHYYGLRIKSSSPLQKLMEDQQHLAMRQQPFSHKHRLKPVQKVEGMTNGMGMGMGSGQGVGLADISTQVQQYQQFLDAARALPEFPDIDVQDKPLPDGILPEHIQAFQQLYREHCEAIVDVMVNLQFPLVETLWKSFWRFSEGPTSELAALELNGESEKRLPKSCLVLLCKYDPVLSWSRNCDNSLYQTLVEILIPDVLRPIPSDNTTLHNPTQLHTTTTLTLINSDVLESWLTSAMMNIPEEMVRIKVVCAGAFAQTLRRYTSLNHLAQAARAVLQNSAQITQMLNDLNRVDFTNVQEQASWVCVCEERVVQQIEQDFKLTLQQQKSLEQWAAWLDGVVSQVLKPYASSPAFPKAAKLFLLKWSFYRSVHEHRVWSLTFSLRALNNINVEMFFPEFLWIHLLGCVQKLLLLLLSYSSFPTPPLLPRKKVEESRRGEEEEEWREGAVIGEMGQLIPFR
uniref:Regulatory factor X1 n=1 Tax=Astyanax mexicanus TaxID=7994 RepID=A0A3B1K4I4_ASTMX